MARKDGQHEVQYTNAQTTTMAIVLKTVKRSILKQKKKEYREMKCEGP